MNFIHFLFTFQYFLQEHTTVLGTTCIYTEEISTEFQSSHRIHFSGHSALCIFSYLFMFSLFFKNLML